MISLCSNFDSIFLQLASECSCKNAKSTASSTHSANEFSCTVHAEIIIELILERAGSVIFNKNFLLELIAFRLIPVIGPARRAKLEIYWKQ